MESNPRAWIATLRGSHDRLAALVKPMAPEQIRAQSYCTEWSIAQVLSHLGSGAEISLANLPAALGKAELLGGDAYPAIWERWNSKSPDEQAADSLTVDAEHVAALERLSDADLAGINLALFGLQLDAAGLVSLRLGEHAVHSWDIAVAVDPLAAVAADAVELLIDNVAEILAPRLAKPPEQPFRVRIVTSGPERDYLLDAGEQVAMSDWHGDAAAGAGTGTVPEVRMPAEALLRLAYGRLDATHTPASVSGDPADLDKLRAIFPGF